VKRSLPEDVVLAVQRQLGAQARVFASQYRWHDIARQKEAVYLQVFKPRA